MVAVFAMAVTGLVTAPSASAAPVTPNIDSMSISVDASNNADFYFSWSIAQANPGDHFTIELPTALAGGFPGFGMGQYANATVNGQTVTVTFTSAVKDMNNIRGTAQFHTRWTGDNISTGGTSVSVWVNNSIRTVPVSGGGSTGEGGGAGAPGKGGIFMAGSPAKVLWGIASGSGAGVGVPITITDTPGAGHTIDCNSIGVYRQDIINGNTSNLVDVTQTIMSRSCSTGSLTLVLPGLPSNQQYSVSLTTTVTNPALAEFYNKANVSHQGRPGTDVDERVRNSSASGDSDADPSPRQGKFSVRKALSGAAASDLPAGIQFPFEYSVNSGSWTRFSVAANQTWTSGDFAVGTRIQVREVTTALPGTPGWRWVGMNFTNGSQTYNYTIIGDATGNSVATNRYERSTGSFSLNKVVSGAATSSTADYTFDWWVNDVEQPNPLVLRSSGLQVISDQYPAGTVIRIKEREVPGGLQPGYRWGQADYKLTPATSALGTTADGSRFFTIVPNSGAQPALTITVTNPVERFGHFLVTKKVVGDGAGHVPAGQTFTVSYTVNGGEPQFLPVIAGETAQSPDFPVGARIELHEQQPANGGALSWGTPSITIGQGVPGPVVAFEVNGDSPTAVEVTNPVTLVTGKFTILKALSGPQTAGLDDEPFTFSVKIGNAPATLVEASKKRPFVSDAIPAGQVVTVSEVAPTKALPIGFEWMAPKLVGPTGSTESGGVVTFTIPRDESTTPAILAVTATNEVEEVFGYFSLEKVVSGTTLLDAGMDFTVDWTVNGEPQPTQLIVHHGKSTQVETRFRVGTKITLTEIAPVRGIPEGMTWRAPVFTGAGVSVTDGVATLTIAKSPADNPGVKVLLTNPTAPLVKFSLSKEVSGEGLTSFDADTEFSVNYTASSGESGTLKVRDGKSVDSLWFEPGTVITLTEVAPSDAAFGWKTARWLTPVFTVDGVVQAAAATTTFTLSAATGAAAGDPRVVAVKLENPSEVEKGSFAVTKEITGVITAKDVPVDFEVNYTVTGDGNDGTTVHSLFVPAGKSVSSPSYPVGSVIRLSEAPSTATLPDGVHWAGYRFLDAKKAEMTAAQLTIVKDAAAGAAVIVTLENRAETPDVELFKGDAGFEGTGDTIVNEADTMSDGQFYVPGEQRKIVFTPRNSGTENLINVVVTDSHIAGARVTAMECTFPDGAQHDAVDENGVWKARWTESEKTAATPKPHEWEVGVSFTCTASLTVPANIEPHANNARVDGTGVGTGIRVWDENPYNSFTAAIQLIKYDGMKVDPEVKDAEKHDVIPQKPLLDAAQDANDWDHVVLYPVDKAQKVRWVVTNTGPTHLTNIMLTDETHTGPAIGAWTCDLTPIGGESDYSFLDDGPSSAIWAPAVSFFCEGPLSLPKFTKHADTAMVTANVIVPESDVDLKLTGAPLLDGNGDPVIALDAAGDPIVLSDDDPFHAKTPDAPLAYTGIAVSGAVLGGVILLVGGLAVLFLVRRRRESSAKG